MKISLENLDKILDKCTKKEIDLILYIGQFQDTRGIISGLHYKRVLSAIKVCKSTFYKLLHGLENKGIIKINYFSEHSYWEVQIIDNVFMEQSDYKKGYFKINYEILHSDEFLQLTKSEKIIVINLLRIKNLRKNKIKITVKKIMEWTGKSLKSVNKFLAKLSEILDIVVYQNLILVDCQTNLDTQNSADTWLTHLISYRHEKANCNCSHYKAIRHTIKIFKQYKINSAQLVMEIVDKSLNYFTELVPPYINKQVQLL